MQVGVISLHRVVVGVGRLLVLLAEVSLILQVLSAHIVEHRGQLCDLFVKLFAG